MTSRDASVTVTFRETRSTPARKRSCALTAAATAARSSSAPGRRPRALAERAAYATRLALWTKALPLVRNAFPEVEVRFFERKAPLDWTGAVSFQSLKPGTVVVAFSRRAVLALAGELNRRQPGRVAVLYGAMPLASSLRVTYTHNYNNKRLKYALGNLPVSPENFPVTVVDHPFNAPAAGFLIFFSSPSARTGIRATPMPSSAAAARPRPRG